jgi:preprotein translocase subunit SecG
MGFIIGLLTAVLVFTCIVLVLLVLIQLPKKEAGLGMAFGGGAADALFGAGAGNVLTKATKYAAGTFFVLSIGLGLLQGRYYRNSPKAFEKAVQKDAASAPASLPEATAMPAARPALPPTPTAATSAPVTVPAVTATNK